MTLFVLRERLGPVDLAFTGRGDGVAAATSGLDLALREGSEVAESWRRVLADFAPDGATRVDMRQVHGNRVEVVTGASTPPPECDALVTDTPGLVLVVRTADCVPVLLADPEVGVVGAAHVGRVGLALDVLTPTIRAMHDLGARSVHAWVGPHVCGRCYEVPEPMQAEVEAAVPGTASTTRAGTPALDLAAGVRRQLAAAGVTAVVEEGSCTLESSRMHSFRRDGVLSGRQAGLVRVRRTP